MRPITTTLEEAKRLGAMALFGEKYGEVVRMVQVGEGEAGREIHTRASCAAARTYAPPPRSAPSTSSARPPAPPTYGAIEAVTGPAAVHLLREHDRLLAQVAEALRTRPEDAPEAVRTLARERKTLEQALKQGGADGSGAAQVDVEALAARAETLDGARVLTAAVEVPDAKALLAVLDRLKGRLQGAAILLGTAADGRVHLVASVAPELVARGVRAGAIVKGAAELVGGGGGGRDTIAQAGGRDPEKLGEAIDAARAAIAAALAASGA